jgi:hypothetical protein
MLISTLPATWPPWISTWSSPPLTLMLPPTLPLKTST